MPVPPVLRQLLEALRHGDALRAEADPPLQRRRDTLRLTLVDKLTLCLGHIAQQLEDDIRHQRARQVPALPSVQQGHVQHDDGGPSRLGDAGPLLQDLVVIAPQPVDTLDYQYVPRLKCLHQPLIQGPVKIFPRLLFHGDVFWSHAELPQGRHLAVLFLAACGYAGIAVHHT